MASGVGIEAGTGRSAAHRDPAQARGGEDPVAAGAALALAAPAKVNLTLHVLGRRPDGYHSIDSLAAFASPADRVTVRAAAALALTVTGPYAEAAGSGADNLVLRAARGLAQLGRVTAGAEIHLEKRLPVAAGIGGGSSDAAATLRLLCALWDLILPPAALAELARGLGADIPVCLRGVPARMTGIGELIDPLPLPQAGLLLVNPGLPLATRDVFAALPGLVSLAEPPPAAFAEASALATWLRARRNDLEPPALALCPPIADVLAAIGATPGCLLARMSGSGTTCFGLYADERAAQAAAGALEAGRPGWWIRAGGLRQERPAIIQVPWPGGA